MRERWKPVVGHEGHYEVSTLGRVRNQQRLLTLSVNGNGYLQFSAYCGPHRQRVNVSVHRAVAQAFLPNPELLPEVDHEDGDRKNCKASNLSWVTSQMNHDRRVARGAVARGEANGNAVLTAQQVIEIRKRAAEGETFTSLGLAFGVSRHTVSKAVKVNWRHVP